MKEVTILQLKKFIAPLLKTRKETFECPECGSKLRSGVIVDENSPAYIEEISKEIAELMGFKGVRPVSETIENVISDCSDRENVEELVNTIATNIYTEIYEEEG